MSVFVGVHPVLTQVPPMSLRSMRATLMPAAVRRPARDGPACPARAWPSIAGSWAACSRHCSAGRTVDRSRLPEVATGFSSGGLIGSTHATQRVARRFTGPRPPSFHDKQRRMLWSRFVNPILHRARTMPMVAHELGSDVVAHPILGGLHHRYARI
jgi:hypothetical protein